MQKVITRFVTPFVLVSALFGCASFSSPRTALGTIQDAAIAARMTIRPVIDGMCEEAKRSCDESNKLTTAYLVNTSDCPEFDACQQARMVVINTLEAVQFAIADANLALALGQEDQYDVAVARALDLLASVQKQMQILGIIPGGQDGK
jgi:di/tricarboxylate transporter